MYARLPRSGKEICAKIGKIGANRLRKLENAPKTSKIGAKCSDASPARLRESASRGPKCHNKCAYKYTPPAGSLADSPENTYLWEKRKTMLKNGKQDGSMEAQLMWMLLSSGDTGLLREPAPADYAGMLEGMEASELLALVEEARRRLEKMGVTNGHAEAKEDPVELFIDRDYTIRLGSPQGAIIPLRPLVRALFILFLKHPEGILPKDRGRFGEELEKIYEVIAPNVSSEDRRRRISRLMDLQDNAFSENLSVLNATLDRALPLPHARYWKVQGYNGHPRRIPLSPLLVHWEE